jgi:hypothetical protein
MLASRLSGDRLKPQPQAAAPASLDHTTDGLRDRSAKEYLTAEESFPLDRCCHSGNGTGLLAVARKVARRNARAAFSLAWESNMPNDKPLKPDDFPVEVEGEELVTADGKPIAKAKTPVIAEDIAGRLNEDDQRKEQDRWSA